MGAQVSLHEPLRTYNLLHHWLPFIPFMTFPFQIAEEKELVLKEVKVIMEETPKGAEEKKTQEEEEKK